MQRNSSYVRPDGSHVTSPIQTSTSKTPELTRNKLPLLKRNGTPLRSTTSRRFINPRPHFSTPYRRAEQDNRTHGASEETSGDGTPTTKKPRISGPSVLVLSEAGDSFGKNSKVRVTHRIIREVEEQSFIPRDLCFFPFIDCLLGKHAFKPFSSCGVPC